MHGLAARKGPFVFTIPQMVAPCDSARGLRFVSFPPLGEAVWRERDVPLRRRLGEGRRFPIGLVFGIGFETSV